MVLVENIYQIQEAVAGVKSKGFITNFFLDMKKHNLWVEKRVLKLVTFGNTLFLLKQNDDFYHLFFCSGSIEDLSRDVKYLDKCSYSIDILGGDKETIERLKIPFLEYGFSPYKSLIRMSRKTVLEASFIGDEIIEAQKTDAEDILSLLYDNFDKRAEQIPFIEEIDNWIEDKTLLLYKKNNRIAGFLAYEISGATQYLRYWFVAKECRGIKIGSLLLRKFFFKGNNSKRQLFWVLKDNENAIKRYIHYGFRFENIMDEILIM
ncbi:MAG: GNAT family N-acetyltransferase [Bacteroidales bacterium]|jgi:ribosomal protein S18 acetylase RimI-like enzyme|nr:GNAT family N-acetyltransferase [Bacteroidales bacterium]